MGVIAGLNIVPAKLFNKDKTNLKPGASIPRKEEDSFYLDKAWSGFHEVLRDMPEPLCFSIMGESFEEIEDEELDDLIYISPATAKRINAALARLTEERMIAALKEKGIVSRYSKGMYEREFFRILKKAYRTAAKKNAGLSICIG